MSQVIRARLGVNVDHVATIRQARGIQSPDPVAAAALAEAAGADQITVHLREDRRHIQDRDVRVLRETTKTRLNLEMATTDEMLSIAREIRPDLITLVPEKREERTTEGGLDVAGQLVAMTQYVSSLKESGAHISMFVDPDIAQLEASLACGAEYIELHTGDYCADRSGFKDVNAFEDHVNREFERLSSAAAAAADMGLRVAAGHGLDYTNVIRVAAIQEIEEFNIGHSIVGRAVLVGFERAVREMIDALDRGRLHYAG